MSIVVFNRLQLLEEALAALTLRVAELEAQAPASAPSIKTQACEERPHTLSLRDKKADSSHA